MSTSLGHRRGSSGARRKRRCQGRRRGCTLQRSTAPVLLGEDAVSGWASTGGKVADSLYAGRPSLRAIAICHVQRGPAQARRYGAVQAHTAHTRGHAGVMPGSGSGQRRRPWQGQCWGSPHAVRGEPCPCSLTLLLPLALARLRRPPHARLGAAFAPRPAPTGLIPMLEAPLCGPLHRCLRHTPPPSRPPTQVERRGSGHLRSWARATCVNGAPDSPVLIGQAREIVKGRSRLAGSHAQTSPPCPLSAKAKASERSAHTSRTPAPALPTSLSVTPASTASHHTPPALPPRE